MIPPVSERSIRPCYTIEPNGDPKVVCCFCTLDHMAEYGGDNEEYQGEEHIPRCSRTKETWPTPCKYHTTLEEVAEAVDMGAFDLRALVYIPPPLDDYDGTIWFRDAGEESYVVCFDDTIFYMLDPEYDHSNLDKEIAGAV